MTRWCPFSCGFCKPDTPGNQKSFLTLPQLILKNLLWTILSYLPVSKLDHALWTFLSEECFYLPDLQTRRMCHQSVPFDLFIFFMADCTHPKETLIQKAMMFILSSTWASKFSTLFAFFFMTKWKFLTCLAGSLEFTVLFFNTTLCYWLKNTTQDFSTNDM